ncbi:MAG: transglycosylase SLT domain-containing protein [Paracoccaceae bacterium]
MGLKTVCLGLVLALPLACTKVNLPELTALPASSLPAMRWDHRPEAAEWTTQTLVAVSSQDPVLAQSVPSDIAAWCPGYVTADLHQRRAFWVAMLSAVAKYESSWNPTASGGGGRYIGLTQISPKTARNHGCAATSAGALKDGSANLACAVKIVAAQVGRDRAVSGNGRRGMGRDWGPFSKAAKRAEMQSWTKAQSYCQ